MSKNTDLSKLKGAIFDVDGTLLDSMYIWTNTAELFLKRRGIETKADMTESFITMSLSEGATFFKENFETTETIEEIMQDINNMVQEFYFDTVVKKPFVKEFLEKLKQKNVKMCIATATDKYLIEKALERNGILEYFSEIYTCTIVGEGKTKPKIYDVALEHLGTEKENTFVFEDAHYAIKTCKNAGYNVVAISDICEEKKKEEIIELADIYVNDYQEAISRPSQILCKPPKCSKMELTLWR